MGNTNKKIITGKNTDFGGKKDGTTVLITQDCAVKCKGDLKVYYKIGTIRDGVNRADPRRYTLVETDQYGNDCQYKWGNNRCLFEEGDAVFVKYYDDDARRNEISPGILKRIDRKTKKAFCEVEGKDKEVLAETLFNSKCCAQSVFGADKLKDLQNLEKVEVRLNGKWNEGATFLEKSGSETYRVEFEGKKYKVPKTDMRVWHRCKNEAIICYSGEHRTVNLRNYKLQKAYCKGCYKKLFHEEMPGTEAEEAKKAFAKRGRQGASQNIFDVDAEVSEQSSESSDSPTEGIEGRSVGDNQLDGTWSQVKTRAPLDELKNDGLDIIKDRVWKDAKYVQSVHKEHRNKISKSRGRRQNESRSARKRAHKKFLSHSAP